MIAVVPDISAKRAAISPTSVAFEDGITGRTLTYRDLEARAGKAAALLASSGVSEGERVAVLCRNRIEFFELMFACAKIGAIFVPLNWRMPPVELDQILTDCMPALLFYGAEDEEKIPLIMYPPPAIGLDKNYPEIRNASAPLQDRPTWPADATWYLLYTSGTTGRPKGVIYTFGMAVANYVNIGSAIDLRSTDTTLNFLPLFHTAGINLHTLPTLMIGGRVIILPGFDADKIISLLAERRIDTFFGVPTVFQELIEHPGLGSLPLDHVRHWGCGGAPLSELLVGRYRDLGVAIANGMGMTETGPTAFLQAPSDAWEAPGSVGKPQLLCNVRIVAEDGTDVDAGEVGEILFAGPAITPGYWRNEEATRIAFTEDGWLKSGDLGYRDTRGFYYIAGRMKEMFISGGENVFPAEVENVLCCHPQVADAAIVPVQDRKWGEVGEAFLILRASADTPDPGELSDFCRARLAAYKIPARFHFVPDFPRTAAGKVQKHLLLN